VSDTETAAEPEAPTQQRETTGEFACPDCDRSFASRQGLYLHRVGKHGYVRDTPGRGPAAAKLGKTRPGAPANIDLDEQRDLLISNMVTMGTMVSAMFPHTGLTIMSRAADRKLPTMPDEPAKYAPGMATVIMGYAKQDPRILRGVLWYNRIFEGGAVVQLAASVGAALATDLRLVDPHLALMPGTPMEFRPVEMMIGDVVAQIEEMQGVAEEEGGRPEGYSPNGGAPPPEHQPGGLGVVG
jgi:ketosteroid isomerase-like protein